MLVHLLLKYATEILIKFRKKPLFIRLKHKNEGLDEKITKVIPSIKIKQIEFATNYVVASFHEC